MTVADIIMICIGFILLGMVVIFLIIAEIEERKHEKYKKEEAKNQDIKTLNIQIEKLHTYQKDYDEAKEQIDEILNKQMYYPIGTFDKQLEELRETVAKTEKYVEKRKKLMSLREDKKIEIAKQFFTEKGLNYWGFH